MPILTTLSFLHYITNAFHMALVAEGTTKQLVSKVYVLGSRFKKSILLFSMHFIFK